MQINFPVWINADVLSGPNCKNRQAVDIDKFLNAVNSTFPQCTLSLGWTTQWLKDQINDTYSWTDIKKMYLHIADCKQPITFAVSAHLMTPPSVSKLKWLMDVTGGSLTVWASRPDAEPELSELLYLYHRLDKDKVFFDLMPESFLKSFSQKKLDPLSSLLKLSEDSINSYLLQLNLQR